MAEEKEKIIRTDQEWQEKLTPSQFHIARKKGTEPAFTGEYYYLKDAGTYHCVCCGSLLFTSDSKYDSGSGWPSFHSPGDLENLELKQDDSHGMLRIEVNCARCDAHLGHLFDDGPAPTGMRYCINSAAMKFKPEEAAL